MTYLFYFCDALQIDSLYSYLIFLWLTFYILNIFYKIIGNFLLSEYMSY